MSAGDRAELVLRLKYQSDLDSASPDLILQHPAGRVTLPGLDPSVRKALAALAEDGASEEALIRALTRAKPGAKEVDSTSRLAHLYYALDLLGGLGAVSYAVRCGGRELATMERAATGPTRVPGVGAGDGAYVLSRFAVQRRVGGSLLMESPLSPATVWLTSLEARAMVGHLTAPRTADSLARASSEVREDQAEALLALFHAAGMVLQADGAGLTAEDREFSLQQWSVADFLFHARSRTGRQLGPAGVTYRFLDRAPPLEALKPPMSHVTVDLFRPDIEGLTGSDASFTSVVEGRRSIREYDGRPMTADQLGEFLYRAARVRRVRPASQESPYAVSSRPYPGGGACYELEIYPAVRRCEGLEPGFYHYDPGQHRLELVSQDAEVEDLFAHARRATGSQGPRQVVLVVAARFGRVMWKYESIAYAVIMKNTGVLLQNFYLVATSMGLAPCAIGTGNVERFRRLTGLPVQVESSVGEFMLGSLPR